jgi:hypothetical protein
MKRISYKILIISCVAMISFTACQPGKADKDGHEDLEGPADPDNTGGKLGGSTAHRDSKEVADTAKVLKVK